MTNIRTSSPPPGLLGAATAPLFQKDSFDEIIFLKGYDIIKSSAIECPCKGKSGSPKTTCQNCLGLGWFFTDHVETKAIISSANKNTKYQQWSPELTGMVNVTVRNEERFSFMDKITFKSRTSILSEVKPIIDTGTQKFIFASYGVRTIKDIYIFNSDGVKLTKLLTSQYNIKSNNALVIELTGVSYPIPFNGAASIYYEHDLSFNILDLPHDFRSAFIIDDDGKSREYFLPVQGIARRSHLVLGINTNYAGNNLLPND